MPPNALSSSRNESPTDAVVTCQICWEELTRKDQKKINQVTTRFCSASCPAVLCAPCLQRHLEVSMQVQYTGALPKIRCPICLVTVNKQRWRRFLRSDGKYLLEQYSELCRVACSLTCPICHNAQYTHLPEYFTEPSRTNIANENVLTLRPSDKARIPELQRVVQQFSRHHKTITARDVIRYIMERFPESKTICIMQKVLARISDEERRATLLLGYHSLYRQAVTRCCRAEVCFNCKRRLFGEQCPCEVEDDEELGETNCLECRSCRVMLVKVDGCSSVRCLCGFNMNWDDEQRTNKLNRRGLLSVDPFDLTMYYWWEVWQGAFRDVTEELLLKLRASAMLHRLNKSCPIFRESLLRLVWKKRFHRIIEGSEQELRRKFVLRVFSTVKESLRTLVWHRRRFHRKLLAECRVAFIARATRQAHVIKPVMLKFIWSCRFRFQVLGSLYHHFYFISKGWDQLTEKEREVEEENLAFLSIGLN